MASRRCVPPRRRAATLCPLDKAVAREVDLREHERQRRHKIIVGDDKRKKNPFKSTMPMFGDVADGPSTSRLTSFDDPPALDESSAATIAMPAINAETRDRGNTQGPLTARFEVPEHLKSGGEATEVEDDGPATEAAPDVVSMKTLNVAMEKLPPVGVVKFDGDWAEFVVPVASDGKVPLAPELATTFRTGEAVIVRVRRWDPNRD